MKLITAISRADEKRPNAIDDETKSKWLMILEGDYAEMMGKPMPVNSYPEDMELLMPEPYDDTYVDFLCAQIDNYNQDTALYANDYVWANASIDAAKSWYRRNNVPKRSRNWITVQEKVPVEKSPLDL